MKSTSYSELPKSFVMKISNLFERTMTVYIDGKRHFISKPRSKTWYNIELKIGDYIEVMNIENSLIFVKFVARIKKERQPTTHKEILAARMSNDADELLLELKMERSNGNN